MLTTAFLFVASAENGLASTIGQQHAMSGQISAVWSIFASIPYTKPQEFLTHVAQRCAGPIASKTRIKSKGLDGCEKLASTPQVGRGQRELVLRDSH